eukprot:scaffold163574_cov28-Tisochrysis_lutea.AAC.2
MAAGVTPEMACASRNVAGRAASSFSTSSRERPGTEAKSSQGGRLSAASTACFALATRASCRSMNAAYLTRTSTLSRATGSTSGAGVPLAPSSRSTSARLTPGIASTRSARRGAPGSRSTSPSASSARSPTLARSSAATPRATAASFAVYSTTSAGETSPTSAARRVSRASALSARSSNRCSAREASSRPSTNGGAPRTASAALAPASKPSAAASSYPVVPRIWPARKSPAHARTSRVCRTCGGWEDRPTSARRGPPGGQLGRVRSGRVEGEVQEELAELRTARGSMYSYSTS